MSGIRSLISGRETPGTGACMRHPGAEEMIALARTTQPAWGTLTVSRRCEYLARIRLQLARQCGPIANLIASECSKHPLDALSGDVLVSLEHLRYCEKNAPRVLRKERLPKPSIFFRGARFERHYEPRGVALIFGASNYPLQLSLIPLTTALAAGNAVILKCS